MAIKSVIYDLSFPAYMYNLKWKWISQFSCSMKENKKLKKNSQSMPFENIFPSFPLKITPLRLIIWQVETLAFWDTSAEIFFQLAEWWGVPSFCGEPQCDDTSQSLMSLPRLRISKMGAIVRNSLPWTPAGFLCSELQGQIIKSDKTSWRSLAQGFPTYSRYNVH